MDAMNAADQPGDDLLDREIEAALAVDPSPEFVARVRTRLANEPAPSSWRMPWLVGAAGAMAAVVVLAVVLSRPQEHARPVVESGRTASADRELPSDAHAVPGAPSDRPAPAAPVVRATPIQPAAAARQQVVAAAQPAPQPETLIDPREAVALRQLIAGVRDGRVDLTPALNSSPAVAVDSAPITDIVIPPLTIEPLAPFSGAQGARQ